MTRHAACVAALVALLMSSAAAVAQQMPPPSSSGQPVGNHMSGTMNQEQFDRLSDYAERSRRLTGDDKAKGKTLADVLAEDRAFVIAMVKKMPLACEVTDAMKVARGPGSTETYEASCTNGLGYFLVAPETGVPYGFSCFAADATSAADIAAGKPPAAVCALPLNRDMKVMGGQVLARAGFKCTVTKYRWVGQNAANHTEFNEFACAEGPGYMVISALPGADIAVHVETCPQSAARGLSCKFSDNGPPALSLKTFRDALAQHQVACDATDADTRVIGQERDRKRYVVEFRCSQRPRGTVAYIPLSGNQAPFEVVECAVAAKRGARCTFAGVN